VARFAACGLTLIVALGGGCARHGSIADAMLAPPAPSDDTPVEFVNADNPPPTDRAMRVPLTPGKITYAMTEDDTDDPSKAKPVTIRIEHVEGAEFPYRRYTADDRIEHLRVGADGGIELGAVDDLDWGVTNWFDPPVPVMPADLKPGESRKITSGIRVIAMGKPRTASPRDKGTLEMTLTLSTAAKVRTPAGWFSCQHVLREQTVKLGMAAVTTRSEQWYAPGHGMVAQNAHERVRAIIVSWTNNMRLRLIRREPIQ